MQTRFIRVVAIVALSWLAASSSAGPVDFVRQSGFSGGLVVQLGARDPGALAALRVGDTFLVQGLDTDSAAVQRTRADLVAKGLYGQVSVYQFDGKRLPYVDNLVNVLLGDGASDLPRDEILRVLTPGGRALIGGQEVLKPWPAGMDEWSHFLHGPDNNAVSHDRNINLPRSVQWVTGPRWGRSHEQMASVSGAVTAAGRLFYVVDEAPLASIRFPSQWKLVGRDAFNGTLLWKRDIPQWSDHLRHFRAGPVHLPRRLVASKDRVYATLGLAAPVTALDSRTGKTVATYRNTERTEEILLQDDVLYLARGTSEVYRVGGGLRERNEPPPTDYRELVAIHASSKLELWRHRFPKEEFLLPLSLTVRGNHVYCQTTVGVTCFDAATGKQVWQTKRETPQKRMAFSGPTVVATDDVLLCADRVPKPDDPNQAAATDGRILWGVNGWNESGFVRKAKGELVAYDAASGKELWKTACSEGYNSPVDLFVVGDTVWVGQNFTGYDLKTGEQKVQLEWRGAPVSMPHHRCYRDKATEKFLLTGRSGIEVVDFEKGWVGNNSWIRGTCQYGILPANGLLYAPPDACACYNKVKVTGFFAAAPQRGKDGHLPFPVEPPLERGPAYGDVPEATDAAAAEDWPSYRHDGGRTGGASTSVPVKPRLKWKAELGGRLTAPVAAGGTVYVASQDTHTLYALNSEAGAVKWQYTAGGRIDSPPTCYRGRVLFGCMDGWIYCLRAADGALCWRFRAAPEERLVSSYGELESAWPVHGAVLVQNDTLYASAGRNSYLDGGLILYRLNPLTGKQLSRTVVYHIDPDTDKQTGYEGKSGFDMEGTSNDVLSGDGESVFLKHFRFDGEGQQQPGNVPHLFSITGFLGEDWFVRSYWLIGTDVSTGWGGWARAASSSPFGRILCFDQDRVCGYGRTTIASAATGHKADAYHLFASDRPSFAPVDPAAKRRGKGSKEPPKTFVWSVESAPIVRAMVLAGERAVVAGPPSLGKRNEEILAYDNPEEAVAGFTGARGCALHTVDVAEGKTLSTLALPALPVFDGMAAARGQVYLSLRNGMVTCFE